MPTVLEVTDTPVPEQVAEGAPVNMDGISLAAAFSGESIAGHETLFFHHNKGQALRHGQWKLVKAKQNKKKTSWELYNLKQDPTEQRNVADQMPQKVQELAAIWGAESDRLATQAQIE